MTKRRRTRRALINSVISLLICFSMLLGTTFAWFTDSVESKNNIIKAGNLDVEMYYQVEGQSDWTKVDATTNIFKENTLWEPGHTEVVKLKVANEGTLALKYQLGVNIAKEIGSVNKDGNAFKLSEYIYYGVVDGAKSFTREEAVAAVADSSTKINVGFTSVKDANYLETGKEKVVTLVVYMPTTVENEANYGKGQAVPEIHLGINLIATQKDYESDSFGNDYDVMAPEFVWDGSVDTSWYDAAETEFALSNPAQLAGLAKLVNDGNNFAGKTVKLAADMDLNNLEWTPIGVSGKAFNGRFIGTGYTIYNLNVSGTKGVGLIGFAGNAAHIEGVHVVNAEVTGINSVGTVLGYGYLAADCLKNCTVENATVIATAGDGKEDGDKVGAVAGWTSNGNIMNNKAIDCDIYGCRDMGGIVGYVNGENRAVEVSGNTIENVTLNILAVEDYKELNKLGTNIAATVGRVGADNPVTILNNSGEIKENNGVSHATSNEELVAALTNNATVLLDKGTYDLPTTSSDVTISGTKDTEITINKPRADKVTLNGVTVVGSGYATGIQHSDKVVYENCVIKGVQCLYANEVEIKNCTIDLTEVVDYIWTYGAKKVTFDNCVFNTNGKAILIYNEGADLETDVTVKNCTFNATASALASGATAAAIEIDSSLATNGHYTLTTENNTVDSDFAGEWRIKKSGANNTTVNGKVYNAITVDGITTKTANTKEELTSAINAGSNVSIELAEGNYEMPDGFEHVNLQGKTLTIRGTKDTVIDVSNIDARDQFVTDAKLEFDGVTLNFGKVNYMGFANAKSLTYKNCTINGLQFLYGPNVTFENCDLNANDAEHCVWTYGAQNVNFVGCDFTYGDRGINCYSDNDVIGGKQTVNFTDCTFATENTASDGAVEINSCYFSVGIEVNMDNCTAPAYGEMAYVSPWDSTNGAKTTINIK